jgi:Ca2+-binding EF-hand superfamily protein
MLTILFLCIVQGGNETRSYDVNADGVIDDLDMQEIWDHRDGTTAYNEKYDLNNDGKIDVKDIHLVMQGGQN